MQAIITKFLPATNTKGARIKATAAAGSVTVQYSYELNEEGEHKLAAKALCDKFGWKGELVGGGLPSQDGFAFVFVG